MTQFLSRAVDFSAQPQFFTLWFFTTYCPLTVATSSLRNYFLNTAFSKSRGRDFFLKGVSIVTPQNFGLVLME